MKRVVLLLGVVALIAAALYLGFAFPTANTTPVDLDLLAFRVEAVEIWVLALCAFFAGVAVTSALASFLWMRGAVLRRRYRKVIRKLESEVHQLRSLPLSKDPDMQVPPDGDALPAAEAAGGRG